MVGVFAPVAFIARAAAYAATFPRGIAQTRGRGKKFSAHAFFPHPLKLRAAPAHAKLAIFFFAARAFCSLLEMLLPQVISHTHLQLCPYICSYMKFGTMAMYNFSV
jgi:hypothetical protein